MKAKVVVPLWSYSAHEYHSQSTLVRTCQICHVGLRRWATRAKCWSRPNLPCMESRPLSSRVSSVASTWSANAPKGVCSESPLRRETSAVAGTLSLTTTRTNLTGSPSWSCLPRRDISAVSSSFRVMWRTVALMSRHTGMAAASTCTNSLDGPPLHPTRARTSIVALLTTKTISV